MRKKITLIFLSCLSIISILLTSCVETDTETSIDGLMAGNGFFVYEIPLGGAGTWLEGDGTWSVPAGGGGVPGGLDTQVQYNNGGAFGGDAGLVYDDALNDLTADGSITSTNGDIVTTTGDINSGNDVNVTNDLEVTDDVRIGGTTNITGALLVTGNSTFTNGISYNGTSIDFPDGNATHFLNGVGDWAAVAAAYTDDVPLNFGTGSPTSLLWETADANANALLLALPVSDGTDIPALVIGDVNAINVDLGLLNSFTFPSLNVIDTNRDSYLSLTYSADDAPMIIGNRNIQLKPNADLDDYFTFATVSNIPTIYGTGAYTRFGDAGTANRITSSEDNVHFSGMIEVDNTAYFEGGVYLYSNMTASTNGNFETADNQQYRIGSSSDAVIAHVTSDTNANLTMLGLPIGTAVNVPVLYIREKANYIDVGLFDGITQPLVVVMDKDEQLHSATDGIANDGGATSELNHVGGFTNGTIGDIVRITAGTNCVAGWYWVTTLDSADMVHLDRNYTTGDAVNVTFVTYHSFPMIGADGVCLKTFDGAPSDSDTEIDRDGWLQLDCSIANGRLYWRSNNGWHYVDATAGISLPSNERVDKNGHEFQIGDTVQFCVDEIRDDGSFHALPYYGGSNITDEAVIRDLIEQILKEKGIVK